MIVPVVGFKSYLLYHLSEGFWGMMMVAYKQGMQTNLAAMGFPQNYNLIASVEGRHMDDVFARTQNVDFAWTGRTDVQTRILPPYAEGGRSTSVGDVIETPEGELSVVMPFGFSAPEKADDDVLNALFSERSFMKGVIYVERKN